MVSSGVITGSAFADGVPADWAEMIDVNLRGLLHATQVFADPLLGAADRGEPVDVVLIGAVSTEVRAPRFAVFNALSASIKQLARALREEYGPRGVRLHIVEPSFAAGDTGDDTGPYRDERAAGQDSASEHARASAAVQPSAIAAVVALAAALPAGVNLAETLLLPSGTA